MSNPELQNKFTSDMKSLLNNRALDQDKWATEFCKIIHDYILKTRTKECSIICHNCRTKKETESEPRK